MIFHSPHKKQAFIYICNSVGYNIKKEGRESQTFPAPTLSHEQKQLHSYLSFPIQEPVALYHQLVVKRTVTILFAFALADRVGHPRIITVTFGKTDQIIKTLALETGFQRIFIDDHAVHAGLLLSQVQVSPVLAALPHVTVDTVTVLVQRIHHRISIIRIQLGITATT